MNEAELWALARHILTEKELEALELVCRFEFTITLTADILQVSEGAVRSRLDRGIRRLRHHVGRADAARTLATIRDRSRPRPSHREGGAGLDRGRHGCAA